MNTFTPNFSLLRFNFFLLAITLLASLGGFAQRKCGTMIVNNRIQTELLEQYPNGFKRADRNIANEFAAGERAATVYNIPVIVHIINNGEAVGTGSNISVAQVLSQIDVLNQDYRNANADTVNTPQVFKSVRADVQLNFCLAAVDKNGKVMAQPGIDRINRNDSGWSAPPYSDTYIDASIKPRTVWDPTKYLNVWVLNLGNNLLGYAQFPNNTAGLDGLDPVGGNANTDGVVILYRAFGSVGTISSPYTKGRTATHEIGHFFGLLHVWGDAYCGNDYCGDTPQQEKENYGCPSFPHVSCTNGPNGDMFMNYMDYANDACMSLFTNDQKTRVQAVMAANTARRTSLASSTVCNGNIAPVANFTYAPNPVVAGTPVTFTDASIGGIPSTWSWSFQGGTPATSSSQTPVPVFNAPGSYTVSLTVTNAFGTSTLSKTVTVGAPSSDFSYSPTSIVAGNTVSFTDLSTGTPTAWSWNFAGAATPNTSTDKNPVVQFTKSGIYTITLNVTNVTGTYGIQKIIYVDTAAARFTYAPLNVLAGNTVAFTDASTGSPTVWSWNFGGGGTPNTSNVKNPSIQFLSAGTFNVTLTTINAEGTKSIINTVKVTAPAANFTYTPLNISAGNTVAFTDSSTGSPTAWSWNFGGGGTPNTSALQNPSPVFSAPGSYNVTLTATNPSGSYSITKTLNVAPVKCLDTLTNFSGADTLYKVVSSTASGYISGHNSFSDAAKADKFIYGNQPGKLMQLVYYFGKKTGTGNIKATVWNANGAGGKPLTVLSTQTVSIASLAQPGLPTVITLPAPLTITGDYYVGIELTYANGDTVALLTNKMQAGYANSAWEKFSNNTWYPYTDANSWGYSLSHKIYVVFDNRPAISVLPATITQCQGTPVTLTASGGTSYLWSPAATLNATTGSTVTALPAANTIYMITGTGANGCTNTTSAAVNITNVKAPATAPVAATICSNFNVGNNGSTYSDASCNEIARVAPSGVAAVSGTINTCMKIENATPYYSGQPYVQRHFDIVPATNAGNATGTITLYFTDADFIAFNNNKGIYPPLPTVAGGANNDPARSNLFVTQYHGTSTTGLPGSYTGTAVEINPDDNNVFWNSTMNAWEVTFNVTGFSGFFVHAGLTALPVTMEYFKGEKQGSVNTLAWKSNCLSTSVIFDVQRSSNGIDYFTTGSINATQARCSLPFDFTDNYPLPGTNYYRLKITEIDGYVSYSGIIKIINKVNGTEIISLVPTLVNNGNAVMKVLSAKDTKLQLSVTDAQGRLLQKITENLTTGYNTLNLNFTRLAAGTYNISGITAEGKTRTIRFVKQ